MSLKQWHTVTALLVMLCASPLWAVDAPQARPQKLRVMSFNLWHGGDAGRQPLEQTAAVIKAANADLVGMQETHGHERNKGEQRPDHGAKLAALLGWHHLDQGGRTGILSRHPITGHTPRKWGATVELADGRKVMLFNAHFAHAPYQPYQLLKIPYADAPFITTAKEAVDAANQARGQQVAAMLAEVREHAGDAEAVFVTGDFNEPSHLDWTDAVARAGRCPLPVEWPTTKAVMDAGFSDAIRHSHPDPLAFPAFTWTPVTKATDPKDRHDRIDFLFVRGKGVTVKAAQIVGESKANADIVVTPYPSDHRAVVGEFVLPGRKP